MTRLLRVVWALVALVVVALVADYCGGDPSGGSEPPPFRTPAVATQTWPATETPAATPTVAASRRYYVTYYGLEFEGGPLGCGSDVYGYYDPDDPTTAASGDGGPVCGSHLTLCSDAQGTLCQVVVIKDTCGGCGPDHLDLSRAAWLVLGQPEYVVATFEAVVLRPSEARVSSVEGAENSESR